MAFAAASSADTLKTVIGENMSLPWYSPGSKGEPKGITPEYLRALEKKLGKKIEILVLPKYRIREYYKNNLIDFNCYTNPQWAGSATKNFQWSHPLFTVTNLIVSNNGTVASLDSLKGQTIGTVLKYNYPKLTKKFSSREIIRDDATNEEANIVKLENDRFKYAVVDGHHLAYYLRSNPNSKINPNGLLLEEIPVSCWIRKGSELKLEDLNTAIDQIKSEGILEKIFQKYR
ncbi:ABC transporter substrate-binding protein [Bdellovibrio sp. NC01]|uniref:substrate-binding periplasmic protein n=1 Tax=Bdellovibrio sp. NC01 TaxID=2220073 RepID=UPI001FEFF5D0|nr:transporter substrate-binding domain-containing protein [Bdellovibrio sp. NC01]